jgi:hypothetical protein
MKGIILLGFLIILLSAPVWAQGNLNNQMIDSNAVKIAPAELITDSVNTNTNSVIKSNVNKDGVIEITRKEFDKIPLVRQEMIRNDKHYKIIED